MTRRWSYARLRAATAISCVPGNVRKSANSFSLAPPVVPSEIAAGDRRAVLVTLSYNISAAVLF